MCAAALSDPDARTQFWTHVLDPPVTSFKQLMASETFTKQYQQEDMKKQVLYHIDNFIGNKSAFFLFSSDGSPFFMLLCLFVFFLMAAISAVGDKETFHQPHRHLHGLYGLLMGWKEEG